MGFRWRRALRPLLAVVLAGPIETPDDVAGTQDAWVQFAGRHSRTFEWWGSRAVSSALARLADPRCRQVFSDFHDGSGRTLQSRLDERHLTAASYLRSLLVMDGDRLPFCQSRTVLAGTRPGSRMIVLCGVRFARHAFHDPALAAAVILHEELHCLGLPENPPSPDEITRRILARCGR